MPKNKNNHRLGRTPMIFVGISIILALMGLNYIFDFISVDEKLGWVEYIERGLQIGNTIIITWITIRFARFIIWEPYAAKHKRPAPKSLVDLVNVGIIALAVIYATTRIFGADLWAIVAVGGLLGAGVAFALQGPILDLFSGVVLDLEKPYKIGDWLELPSDVMGKGGMMGKVVAKNWRTTTLEDPDQVYVVVPNGVLSQKGFRNFCRPQNCYMDSALISLDHELPVIFGVLTTENLEQAKARVGGAKGHKGKEAAEAAIAMVEVLRNIN